MDKKHDLETEEMRSDIESEDIKDVTKIAC